MKRNDEDPFTPDEVMSTVDWIGLLFAAIIVALAVLSFSEKEEGTVNTHPSQEETHNETIEDTDRNQGTVDTVGPVRTDSVDTAASGPGVIPDEAWQALKAAGGECHMTMVLNGSVLDTQQPNPIRVPLAWCRAAYGIAVQPS